MILFTIAIYAIIGLYVIASGTSQYWHSKPFRYWSRKRWFFLAVSWMWGAGFILFGLAVHFHTLVPIALVVIGISSLLMVFVPCGLDFFNRPGLPRALRAAVFAGVGVSCLLVPFT